MTLPAPTVVSRTETVFSGFLCKFYFSSRITCETILVVRGIGKFLFPVTFAFPSTRCVSHAQEATCPRYLKVKYSHFYTGLITTTSRKLDREQQAEHFLEVSAQRGLCP
jgi:hypothetical protein